MLFRSLGSQTILSTLNAVDISTGHTIPLTAETPLALTLNSVSLSTDVNATLASQRLAIGENSVSIITDQNIVVGSQTIYTTLNGLRLWKIIPTLQPGNCPDHCDGQWTPIPFDTLVYGDDFAIAAEPIGCLPQPLPPIRKFPGADWSGINTQTTTKWSNIPT